jgi:hypothetical protein
VGIWLASLKAAPAASRIPTADYFTWRSDKAKLQRNQFFSLFADKIMALRPLCSRMNDDIIFSLLEESEHLN